MTDNTKKTDVFRYKFDEILLEPMKYFAKLHSHDTKEQFVDAWELWKDENKEIITRESTRLTELGYRGDIYKKIYKSVRYYFSKKPSKKTEPKERKKYCSINKDILEKMDSHIMKTYAKSTKDKPCVSYDTFMDINHDLMCEEQNRLRDTYSMSKDEIINKFKKTYKNRYFIYSKKA